MSLLSIAAFSKIARNHCSVAINRIPVPHGLKTDFVKKGWKTSLPLI